MVTSSISTGQGLRRVIRRDIGLSCYSMGFAGRRNRPILSSFNANLPCRALRRLRSIFAVAVENLIDSRARIIRV